MWIYLAAFSFSIILVAFLFSRFGSVYRGTPAVIFATPTDLIGYLLNTFSSHNEKEYEEAEKLAVTRLAKTWSVKEDEVLIGGSCRCVFDIFLGVLKKQQPTKNRVLATSMMHTSFPKAVKFNELELDLLDINLESYQFIFDSDKYDPNSYLAVVVTHAFGRSFEMDSIVSWAKANNIVVFEDAVQAQMFPLYTGHPLSDIIVCSGGLDKIPSSFGGSPVLIKNNPSLRLSMKKAISKLQFQTHNFRLRKLLEGSFLYVAYNNLTALTIVIFILTRVAGLKLLDCSMGVRKNASGFVHDRELYLTKPSLAGMKAIAHSLNTDWTVYGKEMAQKFKFFRSILNDEVKSKTFPWIKKNESNSINDSCFYLHLYFEEPNKVLEFLDSKGYIAMIQQSWYDPGEGAPNTKELSKKMIILPLPLYQSRLQIKTLALLLNEYHNSI